MLKTLKTYLYYSSISLLRQKIDSFELATTKEKFKAIAKLEFFKFLKDFEKYLNITEYLRNYVSYYAQKVEVLQKQKTTLLKNNSIKRVAKKSFNIKILLDHTSEKKLKSY